MGNQGRPQYPYNNQNRNQNQRFGYQPDSGRQGSQYYQQTGQQRQYYNQGAGGSSQQRGQNYQSRDRDQQQGQNFTKETQVQPYKPIVVDSEFRPTTGAGTSQQTEVDRGNRLEKMIEQILVESQNASKLAEQRFHHSEERFHAHEAELRSQKASIQNVEKQVGQMAKTLSERQQGGLPGNTEENPKGGNRNPPPL
jgi:DNA anti-recombination protein RmuC